MTVDLRVVADDGLTGAVVSFFLEATPRTIALSGGATPRPVYEGLAKVPYDWAATDIFFGDERCVAPDHADSNFRMANDALLSHISARVHPMDGARCDARGYERELTSVFGAERPAFDLIFLGLGEDGHTASLFPGDPALLETVRSVVLVTRPDHRRLTLTLPVLNAARVAVFLVAGSEKRVPLTKLLAGEAIPAAAVAARRTIVFADEAAAGRSAEPR